MTASDDSSSASPRRRLGLGAAVVLVIAALAVTVAIGILRGASAPVEHVVIDEGGSDAATPASQYVHVSGAVTAPGLYVLAAGARVVDAVAAAGGFAADADQSAVNLARPVADGEQLHVPAQGETPDAGGPAAPAGDGRVNLNTADVAALDTLPRIGEAMAKRIIDWREQNGRFTSVEDLLAVPGIGDKMLEALRDLVVV
ncbi:ComEA family DNA-binding protein [Microbacterium sp. CFH 31415]|uniref:ComEA family DNA-binding protein n=1 Tax=Microbacterium sp. CFH 31415 TaxID=2921732 RepID=UPI001F13E4DB|nr:ComEA family DNA-binding protein [Microbacterium sp. CFH 31415]MCH6229708.1 ComEA family DNA-binding protein [Microbacterium sp. CFH 31415]